MPFSRIAACMIVGIITIGFSIVASYGFGTYVGLVFSPLMSILPFILLGIGVDGASDPSEHE